MHFPKFVKSYHAKSNEAISKMGNVVKPDEGQTKRGSKVPIKKQKATGRRVEVVNGDGKRTTKVWRVEKSPKGKKANDNLAESRSKARVALRPSKNGKLFDPLHIQNRFRHDKLDIIIIEKNYHSGAKYIRQLEPVQGKTIDFTYQNSRGHVFYQRYLPLPKMNIYHNKETGKRVTTWPKSRRRKRVEWLRPEIHAYKAMSKNGKKYYHN